MGIKYGVETNYVTLNKDVYAEQFAEPGEIKTNYMVQIHGDTMFEGEDPKRLAKELRKTADRLNSIALFLINVGMPRPKGLERGDID